MKQLRRFNNQYSNLPPKILVWGGTGQAKVIRPIIEYYGSKIIAVFDDTPNLPSPFPDVSIYYGYQSFLSWIDNKNIDELGFCIAIGNPYGNIRLMLHDRLSQKGLHAISVQHPTAWVASNATIGPGSQLMIGSIIAPESKIGRQCIINTKASVDHECILDDGVELAPGATLCGLVQVGRNATIYAGATVLPRRKIGKNSIIGAGAVVTKDVPDDVTVVGVPARLLSQRRK